MEHEPHGVGWPQLGHLLRVEEEGLNAGAAVVDLEHVPVAVEHERGIRLLSFQDEVERAAGQGERRRIQIGHAVDRRESGRGQQIVAVAQRHVEGSGELEDHLTARLGPAGLDEADVTARDPRFAGEIELAQLPSRPPVADQRANVVFSPIHGVELYTVCRPGTLPPR